MRVYDRYLATLASLFTTTTVLLAFYNQHQIDLYYSLYLFELVAVKYADRPNFLAVAVRALAYFEDAEQQPMPRMLMPVDWADVRSYCETAALRLARRLSGLG